MFGGFDEIFRNMNQMMTNMNNMHQAFNQASGGGQAGGPSPMDPFGMLGGGLGPMMNPFGMLDNMLMPPMPHGRMGNQLMNSLSNQRQMSSMMMSGGMPGTQSYSYSSSVQFRNDGTGQPRVVERTSSAMCGADGVRETQATHRDSGTGVQEMSIGRHIRDRGHVMKKKRNVYTGDREEVDQFINLEERETDQFHQEFNHLAGHRSIHRSNPNAIRHHHQHRSNHLAISGAPSSSASSNGPEIVEISSEPLQLSSTAVSRSQPVVVEEDDDVQEVPEGEEVQEVKQEEPELKIRPKKHKPYSKKNHKPYSKN